LLREAGKALEIEVLDHVILGDAESDPNGRGWYSFGEAGLL
jgi:DNA repair protein RadC